MENLYTSREIIRIARKFSKKEIKKFLSQKKRLNINSPIEMNIIIDLIACLHFFDCLVFKNDVNIKISFMENFEDKLKTIILSYDNINGEGYTIYKNHIYFMFRFCQNYENLNEDLSNIITSSSIHEIRHRIQRIYNFNNKSLFYKEETLLRAIDLTSFIYNINIRDCKTEKEKKHCMNYLNDKFEEDSMLIENMFLCKIDGVKRIGIEDIKEILISKSLIL